MKRQTCFRRSVCSTVLITLGMIVIYQFQDSYVSKVIFQNVTSSQYYIRSAQCNVKLTRYLNGSGLEKIQQERKSRIKQVCDKCRRNRTSMECNHLTMDEDHHNEIMYDNFIVDDKHEVGKCLYF